MLKLLVELCLLELLIVFSQTYRVAKRDAIAELANKDPYDPEETHWPNTTPE